MDGQSQSLLGSEKARSPQKADVAKTWLALWGEQPKQDNTRAEKWSHVACREEKPLQLQQESSGGLKLITLSWGGSDIES